MRYRFSGLAAPLISNELPQPKSMLAPLFLFNVADHPALADQLALMRQKEASATYAMTSLFKDGAIVTGADPSVRNTMILPSSDLLPNMQSCLHEMARLAWGHFGFHAKQPIANQSQVLIYRQGGFFVSHYDDSRGDRTATSHVTYRDRPDRSLTVLVYLNDDYEGGEIRFNGILDESGIPLTIKPKAGDVVAFPPHEAYRHEVLPVKSGVRFNVSQWFDDTAWFKSFGPLNIALRAGVKHALQDYATQSMRKHFVPDEASSALSVDYSNVISDRSISTVWMALKGSSICHDHALIKAYSHTSFYGLEEPPCRDDTNRNSYITMIYAVDEWNSNWGGETLFPEHNFSSNCSPWNIVQFRADMPRVEKSPSKACGVWRQTLVFKSRRIYEIPAKDRPNAPA